MIILNEQIEVQDALAFINNQNTYQPFKKGFQKGINVNELCDTLSELSLYSTDTRGRVKTYTMTFGNCTCTAGGGDSSGVGSVDGDNK